MRTFLLAAVCLAGCNAPVAGLPMSHALPGKLSATYTDCSGASVLGQTSQFRLRVFADGAVELDETVRASDGLPTELVVSAGQRRRIVIEALDANGTLIAIARSDVRTLTQDVTTPPWPLPFRPVDAFTPVCASLVAPRAGHCAVVLNDGSVWLAGGAAAGAALSSTERFDLLTQRFTATRELSVGATAVKVPRAFGSATRIDNGQVVLWGGETYSAAGTTPSSIVLVYDPQSDQYGAVPARTTPASVPRSHHAALRVGADVVVVGGTTRTTSLTPAAAIERIATAEFKTSIDGQLQVARTDPAIAPLDADTAVVAGGAEEPGRIDVLHLAAPMSAISGKLTTARRGAAATALVRGVLVIGGEDAAGNALGSTELVGADATVQPGPAIAARAEACAVTLEDGRALVVGGRSGAAPVASAEVIDTLVHLTPVTFPGAGRVHASCTLMADGSVLVAGGEGVAGALGDAWIFTPR